VSGTVVTFSWYRGTETNNPDRILTFTLFPNPTQNNGPQFTGREEPLNDGSLRIRNVSTRDSGSYTISITSSMGTKTGTTLLQVYEPVSKPTISSNDSTPVEFSDTVTLTCFASGADVSYHWWRDNQPVSSSGRFLLSNNNQTLTISDILRSDSGPFSCVAFNIVSNMSSDPFSLNISYGPEFTNISLSSQNLIFSVGSPVNFSCHVDSKPPASFTWLLNGAALNENGQRLTIPHLLENNTGNYSCQTFNSITQRYDIATQAIEVYEPVSKPTISSNDSTPVEFNDTVTLTCTASGTDVSYQWWRDNQPVSSSGRFLLSNNNQTLTISEILRTDNGPYTCNASNAVSTNSSDKFFLNISYGPDSPKISISPNSTELSVGSDILFSCAADSNPPATFTWFLNNTSLNENGQNLTITKIQQNNTGNYSCQAFNSDTKRYNTARRAVRVLGVKYSYYTNKQNSENLEEKMVVIFKKEKMEQHKKTMWLFNKTQQNTKECFLLKHENKCIPTKQLGRTDSGIYQCEASNPVSTSRSDEITLEVSFGPDTPTIILTSNPVLVGSKVTLNCTAASSPAPKYEWLVNQTEKGTEQLLVIESFSFSDAGTYTCWASNSITNASNSITNLRSMNQIDLQLAEAPSLSGGAVAGIVIGCILGSALV
uniref:Ig-like domain-containing protein n=1 Tax=Latimeria chalumnae TaxID=7897 RepID=H3ASP0_LATCH